MKNSDDLFADLIKNSLVDYLSDESMCIDGTLTDVYKIDYPEPVYIARIAEAQLRYFTGIEEAHPNNEAKKDLFVKVSEKWAGLQPSCKVFIVNKRVQIEIL